MKISNLPIKANIEGEVIIFKLTQYSTNKRIAIIAYTDKGESYAVLTLNIPDEPLEKDEFFVKTYSENEGFADVAFKTNMFIDTGKRSKNNDPVWKLNEDTILTQ